MPAVWDSSDVKEVVRQRFLFSAEALKWAGLSQRDLFETWSKSARDMEGVRFSPSALCTNTVGANTEENRRSESVESKGLARSVEGKGATGEKGARRDGAETMERTRSGGKRGGEAAATEARRGEERDGGAATEAGGGEERRESGGNGRRRKWRRRQSEDDRRNEKCARRK